MGIQNTVLPVIMLYVRNLAVQKHMSTSIEGSPMVPVDITVQVMDIIMGDVIHKDVFGAESKRQQ